MDVRKQKALYGAVIAVLLFVIGLSVYYLIGGFEKVTILYQEGERRSVVGKYYKGYYAHPDLEDLWEASRELVRQRAIPGQLAVVNYDNDSLDNDEVEQFIGVMIEGGMAEVPPDFEVLEIDMTHQLRVFLPMHPMVRPRPRKMERMLAEFANANGYVLADHTLELHFEDNSMILESPIISIE
ncbi:MAG: hypothetical protein AAGA85_19885 [Bacteroidota bacterium]